MRKPTTFILGVALVAAMSATGCRGWESSKPPIHPNPNMDTQEKLKPYRASTFFADGRAMQTPPEGTVARTMGGDSARDAFFVATDSHMYEGKKDGEFAWTFPEQIATNDATIARGQQRYGIYCKPCHGEGDGKGTVADKLMIPPPDFNQERINNLALGDIFNTISHGKNLPNMPSYGKQISVEDRWAIVMYVRDYMRKKNPKLELLPDPNAAPKLADLAGDPVALGEAVYKSRCLACHSIDGSRIVGPTFKGLIGREGEAESGAKYVVDEAYIRESMMEPLKVVVKGYPPAMPQQVVTDDEFNGLIAYLKTLQ